MKIAILGAGAMGLTNAAFLASRGHVPVIWSPSGSKTAELGAEADVAASGALAGVFRIRVAKTIEDALHDAELVVLAVDAGGHAPVMEMAAPHLKPGVPFIIGAAHSMSGLYLSRLLSNRGIDLPIVSCGTTIGTAHRHGPAEVDIRTIRPMIDAAVMPSSQADGALKVCREAFGDRFEQKQDALAIALLSNCNPVFHVPVCLLNVSRIERREDWAPYQQTSESVGRLMEALDRERVAIGAAFGHAIRSVNEHFHRSFKIPLGSMAQMNATLHAAGRGPKGPKSIAHRYLAQDLSYGLVFAAAIARLVNVATSVHDATIDMASVTLGNDFRAANTLIPRLQLDGLSKESILKHATDGFTA